MTEQTELAKRPKHPPLDEQISSWFRPMPNGTLAVISATCSAMAIGSMGLEMIARLLTGIQALGWSAGLPFPFVSIPLGVGGLVTSLMLCRTRPKAALGPLALVSVYVGLVLWLWP